MSGKGVDGMWEYNELLIAERRDRMLREAEKYRRMQRLLGQPPPARWSIWGRKLWTAFKRSERRALKMRRA
jgi:hypothetical protein